LNAVDPLLRHGEYGAEFLLKMCSKSGLYPGNKSRGLYQMLSASMMDNHLNLRELLHQITNATGMVYVDMGQGDIGKGIWIMTQLPQPVKNRGGYGSRPGFNESWSFIGDEIDHRTWSRCPVPRGDLIHIFGNFRYLGHLSAGLISMAYGTPVHFNIYRTSCKNWQGFDTDNEN
jgi:hypothetical protein